MKKNALIFPLLGFAFTIFGQSYKQATADFIENYRDVYGFSGSVLVMKNDSVLFDESYGYANRTWNVPNQSDTKFRLASITKTFTAIVILKLVEEGLIDLDAPLSNYSRSYPIHRETGKIPTIGQLLKHTSGLPHYYGLDNARIDWDSYRAYSFDSDSLAKLITTIPLEFEPGTKTQYSSLGYLLLGSMIENHFNLPYGKAIDSIICRPLNLERTGFNESNELVEDLANGYQFVWKKYATKNYYGYENMQYRDQSSLFSTGGVYSTTYDLYLFIKGLLDSKVISEELVAEMLNAENGFGIGWKVYDESVWGLDYPIELITMDGLDDGHATRVSMIDRDTYIILLTNSGRQVNTSYITRSIVEILNGKELRKLKPLAAEAIGKAFLVGGMRHGVTRYQELYNDGNKNKAYYFNEPSFNTIGLRLLRNFEMIPEAIEVFKWNVQMYPESINVYDSLAEAYMENGDNKSAIKNYRITLEKLLAEEEKDDEWIEYVKERLAELGA